MNLVELAASFSALALQAPVQAAPMLLPSQALELARTPDGKRAQVRGYLAFGQYSRGIWDSRRDREKGLRETRCLTLVNTDPFYQRLMPLTGKKVVLEGILVGNVTGDRIIDPGACNRAAIFLLEPPHL